MNDFFTNLPGFGWFGGVYVIIRALIMALDVLLLFLFLYALKKSWKYRPHFDLARKPMRQLEILRKTYFKDHWVKLLNKYTVEPTPDSMRLAIIEADTLTDHWLKDMQFPGEHMADRLKHLNSGEIKSLEGVWEAHRLRNDIVHHPSHQLTVKQGMAALTKYERFFKEVKIF